MAFHSKSVESMQIHHTQAHSSFLWHCEMSKGNITTIFTDIIRFCALTQNSVYIFWPNEYSTLRCLTSSDIMPACLMNMSSNGLGDNCYRKIRAGAGCPRPLCPQPQAFESSPPDVFFSPLLYALQDTGTGLASWWRALQPSTRVLVQPANCSLSLCQWLHCKTRINATFPSLLCVRTGGHLLVSCQKIQ